MMDGPIYIRFTKKECLKSETGALEFNSKIKIIRDFYWDIFDLNNGYQPRCNTVNAEKGDLAGKLPQNFG